MMTHYQHLLLLKHKEDKTYKKTTKKKTKRKVGTYFEAPTLPFHFWLPLLPFYFKCFLLASSSFQEKKNHREEKKCKEGRELSFKLSLCPFTLCSYFCPLTFALLFQTFYFGIFFFSSIKKEKKRKKCIERRELTFKLALCPLTFGSRFCPLVSTFLFQTLSPLHLFLLKQKKKMKNTKKKKPIQNKNNVEEGGNLTFFSHFCFWDETLLLLFPFHILSMLSSPPSSSLVFHVSSKFYAIQA